MITKTNFGTGLVVLVHGFNVHDKGADTVDTLRPYFEAQGYKVLEFDYGFVGLMAVRFFNDNLASALASMLPCEAIVVGHSNGCAIANAASLLTDKIKHLVYINPALDSDFEVSPYVNSVHVWHSPSDKPVWFSKFLIHHAWGDAGSKGYTGVDTRVLNIDKENAYSIKSDSHSDVFSGYKLRFFGPKIVERVTQCLMPPY